MIYHVAIEAEWNACSEMDRYAPKAFQREGFVHACNAGQLDGVLQRYFAGRMDLLLLHLDEGPLLGKLVYEPGTDGELFPHIYNEISKSAIREVTRIVSGTALQ